MKPGRLRKRDRDGGLNGQLSPGLNCWLHTGRILIAIQKRPEYYMSIQTEEVSTLISEHSSSQFSSDPVIICTQSEYVMSDHRQPAVKCHCCSFSEF